MALSFRESLEVGFTDFFQHKLRSFITILGIILGTMSIIVVLSIVSGMKETTLQWMQERGGLNKITIMNNWDYTSPKGLKGVFTLKEVRTLQRLLPSVKYFNPTVNSYDYLSLGSKTFASSLMGVMSDYQYVEEWYPVEGRFINLYDVDNAADVIVIGTTIRKELFGSASPIGKYVTFSGKRLMVVGVMKRRYMKGNDSFHENAIDYMNEFSMVPISTAIHKLSVGDFIYEVGLKAEDPKQTASMVKEANAVVLNMREGEPVFRVESAESQLKKMEKSSLIFQLIFIFISTISLFVGGIVIMNIMLATVHERTREIGIRITVGARRIDILLQFLVQTILTTTVGGLFGVIVGLSILKFVGKYLNITMGTNLSMIFLALAVSAGVGFIFGLIPAIKASKMDPVQALRYE